MTQQETAAPQVWPLDCPFERVLLMRWRWAHIFGYWLVTALALWTGVSLVTLLVAIITE